MNVEETKTEWVILEAMGHNRVAGRYYNENGLHRVDIPDPVDPDRFIRTERYGSAAIFRITTVDEATARLVARQCLIPEAIPWDARRELRQLVAPSEPVEAMFPLADGAVGEDEPKPYPDNDDEDDERVPF